MKKTASSLGLLVLCALAVVALGIYAFRTPGSAPVALVMAVPCVVVGRLSLRRFRWMREQRATA